MITAFTFVIIIANENLKQQKTVLVESMFSCRTILFILGESSMKLFCPTPVRKKSWFRDKISYFLLCYSFIMV